MKQFSPFQDFEQALIELERDGLRRTAPAKAPSSSFSFCSNDYLGLAQQAPPSAPSGAGASRLIAGEHDEHRRLEQELSEWLGVDDALVFASGYAANVGAIAALAGRGDLLVSDALNHASIIDGARLSRARVAVVPHGDLGAIEAALGTRSEARAWVLVESYFSMDADGPDLRALRRICHEHRAGLYVDEAHALLAMGPNGRGRCAEAGVNPDVLVGTLGKAFGAQGAFVAGASVLREWLWNKARSFVFSTGLAPSSAAAASRALAYAQAHPELAGALAANAVALRSGLSTVLNMRRPTASDPHIPSLPRLLGFGHVIPVEVGTAHNAMSLAERVRQRNVEVLAVRPPTVPQGRARLRLTVSAAHRPSDIDRVIDAFANAIRQLDF